MSRPETVTPSQPTRQATSTPRRRRFGRGHAALAVAVLATLSLIVFSPHRNSTTPSGPSTVAAAWPKAQQADIPGSLADGPAYDPVYFLDARASVGTAPSPDGTALRLVLRAADGAVRELRRLPMERNPQFAGFTRDGDTLAWAETVLDGGRGRTRMYTADLRTSQPGKLLTADTGDVMFFDSEFDLVIAERALHWASAIGGGEPATEIRSVPLTGGTVQISTEPGAWAQAAWPWLVSGGSDQVGPVEVRNATTGQSIDVPAQGIESTVCGATWCRVLVQGLEGPERVDLMRPDGSDRKQIAGRAVGAAIVDVAPLDRFEILAVAGPPDALSTNQQLLVYDIAAQRTVEVANAVGKAACRGGVLWWSTGEDDATVWHSLDLRTV